MAGGSVVLLTGGLGGARLAPALAKELGSGRLTVVTNPGDDFTWYGVRVWPDFDSVVYALAGLWDADRGWGRRNETFQTTETLRRLGFPAWFGVGDADLALHLYRSEQLAKGRSAEVVGAEVAARLGVEGCAVVPAAAEPAETYVVLADGRRLHFQEWYVGERAEPEVSSVHLRGGPASPAALEAIDSAEALVIGPSNPVTSIDPILALDGMDDAVRAVPRRIGVSPIALRRTSDDPGVAHHARARCHVMAAEGWADTPLAVAARSTGLIDAFVLDDVDADDARYVRSACPVMTDLLDPPTLARTLSSLIDGFDGGEDFRPWVADPQARTVAS